MKELLNENHPNFNVVLDPKCDWAVNHLELFPVEIMRADYYTLLRVPTWSEVCKAHYVSKKIWCY